METIRFLEQLGDTSKSQFILKTPPTTLSMDTVADKKDVQIANPGLFKTRTTITISLVYVPNQKKI